MYSHCVSETFVLIDYVLLYFLNLLVVSSEFIFVSINSSKLLQLTSNFYELSKIFYNFLQTT